MAVQMQIRKYNPSNRVRMLTALTAVESVNGSYSAMPRPSCRNRGAL